MGRQGDQQVKPPQDAVNQEIHRVQAEMAARILNLKPPGRFVGYQDAPGGRQVPVFRKVWRDNNRYDSRGNRR